MKLKILARAARLREESFGLFVAGEELVSSSELTNLLVTLGGQITSFKTWNAHGGYYHPSFRLVEITVEGDNLGRWETVNGPNASGWQDESCRILFKI